MADEKTSVDGLDTEMGQHEPDDLPADDLFGEPEVNNESETEKQMTSDDSSIELPENSKNESDPFDVDMNGFVTDSGLQTSKENDSFPEDSERNETDSEQKEIESADAVSEEGTNHEENEKEASASFSFEEDTRDPFSEDDLFGSDLIKGDTSEEGEDDFLFEDIPAPLEDGTVPLPVKEMTEDEEEQDALMHAENEKNETEGSLLTPRKEKKKLSDEELKSRRENALRSVRLSKIRFCFAVLLTMLLTAVEAFDVFGVDITIPLGIGRVAGSHALLDLQVILLICFCARYSLWLGIVSVFRRNFRAETVLVLSACAVAWFDIDAYVRNNVGALPSALPLAVTLTALVYVEMLEWEVQARTLSLLLSDSVKYAAIDKQSPDGDTLVLAPVRHVDGFDEEIGSTREDSGYQFTIFLLSAGITAGAILLTVFNNFGWNLATSVGMSVFFLTVPFVSLLARRIRFAYLSASFLDGGTAVIGEDAVFRYADVSTFSVEDGDAFSVSDTKIKIVNVFRDSKLDTVLHYLNGIYKVLGGPLSSVLSEICGQEGLPESVKLTELVSGGVSAEVDGIPVHVGSAEYISRKGYMLPESDVDNVLKNDRMCVLFCAFQGEVRARFYIEYALSKAFETRAERLRKLGVNTEVRTFDPNLTRAYFGKISYLPEKSVGIKRMEIGDLDEPETRRAESALVAVGTLDTMLDALATFRRYVSWRHVLSFLKVFQFLLGAFLSAFLVVRYPGMPVPISFSALYSLLLFLLSFRYAGKSGKKVSQRMRSARENKESGSKS